MFEDYLGVVKPKGQNATAPKEGTAARDLESDRTLCFSLCAHPILSVDQHSLFQRLMEENMPPLTPHLLELCVSNPAAEGKRNELISMNPSPKFLKGRLWARIGHVLTLDQSSVSARHPIVQMLQGTFCHEWSEK